MGGRITAEINCFVNDFTVNDATNKNFVRTHAGCAHDDSRNDYLTDAFHSRKLNMFMFVAKYR